MVRRHENVAGIYAYINKAVAEEDEEEIIQGNSGGEERYGLLQTMEDEEEGEEIGQVNSRNRNVRFQNGWSTNRSCVMICAVCLLIVLILLVGYGLKSAISFSGDNFLYENLRLPGDVIPEEYEVYLHPNITDGKFKVTGYVNIKLRIVKETDAIILHSISPVLNDTTVLEDNQKGEMVPVKEVLRHSKHEMIIVRLGRKLLMNRRYVLHIKFAGHLSKGLRGFYKSKYETPDGERRYLATTRFESTDARMAFPCFDEPAMKANFSIIMVREKTHSALANMPIERTVLRKDGLMEDHFQKSVKMSTYLVAFVVCDFSYASTTTSRGVQVNIWAPKHLMWKTSYALQITPKLIDYFEKYFQIDFPLPKLDGMENWGLITFQKHCLLYDEVESSAGDKQYMFQVVAHEIVHQWFGNLVTMRWWNDLWLKEGFASFIEYVDIDDQVPQSWQLLNEFVGGRLRATLSDDSSVNSHKVSLPVSDPADVDGLFDSMTYYKSPALIRMMRDFLGRKIFINGLVGYLKKFEYGNADSDDLWASMSEATNNTINVKKIMDTWILQMGYPVINAFRDKKNQNIIVMTQKHFIKGTGNVTVKSPFNYKWEVPITYYFENNRQKKHKWMHMEDDSVKINCPKKDGWLKVNVDAVGYYRVNYDAENWKALARQLNDGHKNLSTADRSSLIDDAFNFASTDLLSYEQALDLTEYLTKEKHYVPFNTAISSLRTIGTFLAHRPGYEKYQSYIKHLITPLVNELGRVNNGSHLEQSLRKLVLEMAISFGQKDIVSHYITMFNDWMFMNKRVPVESRSLVYSMGIEHGDEREWNFMYNKYRFSKSPSEKSTFMHAMAKTSNPRILKWYIESSLNTSIVRSQDVMSLIESLASGPGRKMTRDFVMKHWDILFERYGRSISFYTFVSAVFQSYTEAELKEVEMFFKTHNLGSGKLAAMRVLASSRETINNNKSWLEKNEIGVVNWLTRKTSKL